MKRYLKYNVGKYITRFGFLIIVVFVIFAFSLLPLYAQDTNTESPGQSVGTQSDKEEEKQGDEKTGEDEEVEKSEESGESEESVSEGEKVEETSGEEPEKADEESGESRDLLKLFEEMKKSGPPKPGEKKKEQKLMPSPRLEKPPVTTQQDFIGPPAPQGESGGIVKDDFVGPTLPDINLPPIDEEPMTELEFELTEPPEGRKYVDFSADKITRDKLKKLVKMEGNAKMIYEDVTILSEFAEFNEEEEWGKFWGKDGVLADNEDGIMKCDTLEAFFKDKIAKAHSNVEIFVYGRKYEDKLADDAPRKERVKRALGKDDTTIYVDEGKYNWGDKIFHGWVEKSDKVRILQEGRHAYSKAVYHDRKADLTVLEGSVELWQKDGNWLFERDVVTDKDDKWANALLKPETTITTDLLESRGEEEITILDGNVVAVQKDKRASADKVTQNEKDKIMVAEGNVKAHQDNGDWLVKEKIVDPKEESEETMEDLKKPADGQSDKFTLWTEKKDFEAEGNIKVWQEHQDLVADKAVYKKEIDRLGVYGNVKYNKKDKDNMIGSELVMWLTTKVYEAFGKVETNKKVDIEEERKKSKEKEDKEKQQVQAEE